MKLTFGKKQLDSCWMTMMLILWAMLSAFSCATVNGSPWQVDSDVFGELDAGENCQTPTGESGICKRISTCEPYVKKMIQYAALRRCSFIGNEEVTCCPQSGTAPTTTGKSVGWGSSVDPPVRTTTTTTSTTTTTTTTTTMSPLTIRDITLTGNEPFFDLSKVLSRTSTTTTRRPQINGLQPILPTNSRRPLERNFNWFDTFSVPPGGSNNVQWSNQQLNGQSDARNVMRFTTTTINPDTEWIDLNAQGPASGNMVQFPSTNSQNTNPIATVNNLFEQFQFRPGSDDDILDEISTVRPIDDNVLRESSGEWLWFSSDTAISPNMTPSPITTTTTTTTTSSPQSSTTEDWILAALRNATSFSPSIPTATSTPVIAVNPFSVTITTAGPLIDIRFGTAMPITTSTVDTVIPRSENERPSQAACRRWRAFNPASLTFHILDGVPVAPGDYPHMGGLVFPVGGGADIDVRCGASLIAEQYALTAAHCVNDPVALPTMVRFGVVVWNTIVDDIQPVDVEIENITVHTDYRSPLRYHDIAIIKLSRNVDFSPFIRPACLNSDMADIDAATPLVVIGWGVTNVQTRARSEVLLMTNVTTVPLSECNATHVAQGVQRTYRNGLNEGHYCAFDYELKKDACQADSGGPLQLVQNKDSTIVGIVSFGLSCASAVPSVYARVAYYLSWIEGIVWPS